MKKALLKNFSFTLLSLSYIACSDKDISDTLNSTNIENIINENNNSGLNNKDENTTNSGSNGNIIDKNSSETTNNNNGNDNLQKAIDIPYKNPLQPPTEANSSLEKYIELVTPQIHTLNGKIVKTLSGEITNDFTISSQYLWKISGEVKIIGSSISIEEGTILYAIDKNSSLIFSNGAKIIAIGSKTKPIIFSSLADIYLKDGNSGDWGGISIINSEDSILKYSLIKYAGYNRSAIKIESSNETNIIENIEIYRSFNDGIELSSSSINLRNIAFVQIKGDSLVLKNGSTNKAQNLLVVQGDEVSIESSAVQIDFGSNFIATNIEILSKNKSAGSGIYSKGGSIHLINSIITGERTGSCIQWETVGGLSGKANFQSNSFGNCSGGFISPANSLSSSNINDLSNIFHSGGDDLRNNSAVINPYSIDNWFDEYNNLYMGSYIENKTWFKNWTIGLEDLD